MKFVGVVAIVLVACAAVLVAGAEWPRLSARFGSDARRGRQRARRKEALTVIEGQQADPDDFAKSVERDLENLPVLGERDDRSRR
jgi:hypothetical protein